jgi:F-type H+-transporting ATPase subunit alpha
MSDLGKQIASELQGQISKYEAKVVAEGIGTVLEAGDGIARVRGLSDIRSQELVKFGNGAIGIAFNLGRDNVGVIVLGDFSGIEEGTEVRGTGRIASVPVGEGLLGRVINPLGGPLDGKGPIRFARYRAVERVAPGVAKRQDVDTAVQTGLIAIDSMIPIGRGQRELIIGDRQTGKTAIAIDTIINQRDKDLLCIYVAIGQKKSSVANTVAVLERYRAMEHTVVVMAPADDSAAMQYIAPYAGCAIGEEFMESGRDALIVYDDLSKHAWAYRQVSLLLRRPPGREAYPGDVFYLHSRLLERAARLADKYVIVPKEMPGAQAREEEAIDARVYAGPLSEHDAREALTQMADPENYRIAKVKGSGGSLTALPIIETLLGDVSAYIPTNVISITDGQIYLEANLFYAGIRPALNVGISVSRVGGDAQTKAMRQVAGKLRLDMAQFRDLAAFAQFGSDLDRTTQMQLNRGYRLQEIVKQPQYSPISLGRQVVLIYAGTNGFADQVALEKMAPWKEGLLGFLDTSYADVPQAIEREGKLSPEVEARLKEALAGYASTWRT